MQDSKDWSPGFKSAGVCCSEQWEVCLWVAADMPFQLSLWYEMVDMKGLWLKCI